MLQIPALGSTWVEGERRKSPEGQRAREGEGISPIPASGKTGGEEGRGRNITSNPCQGKERGKGGRERRSISDPSHGKDTGLVTLVLAGTGVLYLEFVHHFFKHLPGFRAVGLLEVIHNPHLHHDGLQVPAHTWGTDSTCTSTPGDSRDPKSHPVLL